MRYHSVSQGAYTPSFGSPPVRPTHYRGARRRTGPRPGLFPIPPSAEEWKHEAAAATPAADAVAALGAEWSRRRNGAPPAEAMTTWLLRDRAETLTGALRRWRKGQYTTAAISHAWLVSRREQ